MSGIVSSRCTQIACEFEASYTDPKMSRRALTEHLASAHGIGRVKAEETHLGCFAANCGFKVSGSAKFTADELRDHLIVTHKIDPENPELPAEWRTTRLV